MQHHHARLLPIHGTIKKTAAHLDFASLAALHYAQAWAANRGHRKAPLSLILRRALAVYAYHLEAISRAEPTAPTQAGEPLGMQTLREARSLETAGRGAMCASSGALTDEAAQALAVERLNALHGLQPNEHWPSFAAVLYGPEVVARSRAAFLETEARVNNHLAVIANTPAGRRAGLRQALDADSGHQVQGTP